jgi:hypothetical protein
VCPPLVDYPTNEEASDLQRCVVKVDRAYDWLKQRSLRSSLDSRKGTTGVKSVPYSNSRINSREEYLPAYIDNLYTQSVTLPFVYLFLCLYSDALLTSAVGPAEPAPHTLFDKRSRARTHYFPTSSYSAYVQIPVWIL